MNKDNGGPAFPVEGRYFEYGMTLRDYFAAKAMQAYIPITSGAIKRKNLEPEKICRCAYAWADMMLEARGND